jgi:hypothetical protein
VASPAGGGRGRPDTVASPEVPIASDYVVVSPLIAGDVRGFDP